MSDRIIKFDRHTILNRSIAWFVLYCTRKPDMLNLYYCVYVFVCWKNSLLNLGTEWGRIRLQDRCTICKILMDTRLITSIRRIAAEGLFCTRSNPKLLSCCWYDTTRMLHQHFICFRANDLCRLIRTSGSQFQEVDLKRKAIF